jgi:aspartate/methionine/tyrosine aminotransferase
MWKGLRRMLIKLNERLEKLEMSGIRLFTNQASKYQNVIKLTIGEPTFATPEPIKQALKASLDKNRTFYPSFAGSDTFKQEIIAYEKRVNGVEYAMDEILITQGATGAIFGALGSILNPGDEVILFEPTYIAYQPAVEFFQGKPVFVDTTKNQFQLNYDDIKKQITSKTKALIVNSPNNPTGVIYNETSLNVVKRILDEHNVFVISDDVYAQLVYDSATFLNQDVRYKDRILLTQSLSKPYAMTGWRIGYLCAHKDIIKSAHKIQQYAAAGVPLFIQDAAEVALNTNVDEMTSFYRQNRDDVVAILDEAKIPYIYPQGAFYIFIDISAKKLDSWTFASQLLENYQVAVIPGVVFSKHSDHYIRISLAAANKDCKEGVKRLIQFLNDAQ